MRKTAFLVLTLVLFSLPAEAVNLNPFRRNTSVKGGMFPATGDVDDLVLTSKIVTYREKNFQEFYGQNANIYMVYGIDNLMTAEYTYGGKDRRVTIEMATMENPTAAAGLFHHHRGNVVSGGGKPAGVGAESVLDTGRGNRNLYFYRASIFVKILYGGKEPVPDLTPIARYIDSRIPGGRDAKPDGFTFIKIPGVAEETIGLTAGFCFNLSFMPPAVFASAPGGGSIASDVFVITRNRNSDADELFKDYTTYLKSFAEYIEEYRRGKQKYTKAVDPNQGRVVFTAYKNVLIIAARPDGYEKGEALIDAIMAKIDEAEPGRKK